MRFGCLILAILTIPKLFKCLVKVPFIMPTLTILCSVLIEREVRNIQLTEMIINTGILAMVNYHQLRLDNLSNFTIIIMENYHQSYDELDHNAKSELRQSNHYTDGVDTIRLMKTINTIYSLKAWPVSIYGHLREG